LTSLGYPARGVAWDGRIAQPERIFVSLRDDRLT